MPEKVSLNQMIEQIRAWQLETNNFRNDSWTQEAYQEKLKQLFEELNPIISGMSTYTRHGENEDEQK